MSTSSRQCGFCNLVSAVCRRLTCVGSLEDSSDSTYRGLEENDTLYGESQMSEDSFSTQNALPHDNDDEQPPQEPEDPQPPQEPEDPQPPQEPEDPQPPQEPEDPQPPQEPEEDQSRQETDHDGDVEAEGPLDDTVEQVSRKSREMARTRPLGRSQSERRGSKTRYVIQTRLVEKTLLDDFMNGHVQIILRQCGVWKFNAFTLNYVAGGRGLAILCIHLFNFYGLISHFRLDLVNLWKLCSLFEENYHCVNLYHNSGHAVDVTQAMHCFLQQHKIMEHMEPIEVMSSLLAAIAHDVDHPGVNQPFLVATNSHLAIMYQNQSVLENHHWRSAISCLIESQLLNEMPQQERQQLFNNLQSMILATDITRQMEYLDRFKTLMDDETLDMQNPEHRHLVLQIALKCADISNPCRIWKISKMWSQKVCEEFFQQGDVERSLNLPISPLCDRYTTFVPSIQSGFFKFVVTPLVSEWHRFLKNDLSEEMLRNLYYNHYRWDVLERKKNDDTEAGDSTAADGEDEWDDGNLFNSSERLLPRRGSLNPAPVTDSREPQLRRSSMPFTQFQVALPPDGEDLLQDVAGALVPEGDSSSVVSAPSLLDDLLSEVKVSPLDVMPSACSMNPRASRREVTINSREVQSDSGIQFEVVRDDVLRTDVLARSRLHENLTSIPLELGARTKTSTQVEPMTGCERRFRELREVPPQASAHALAPLSERISGRRGSAPAHVTVSSSSGRLLRAVQLTVRPPLPRRSSLPMEVFHHADLTRSSE